MKKRVLSLTLVLLLCLGLVPSALAENKNATPEIKITWLSVAGRPELYNRDLNWLSVYDEDSDSWSVIDLTTNEKIEEWDAVVGFSEGLALAGKKDDDGMFYCFIDKTGAEVIPLGYDYDSISIFSEGLAQIGKMDADGHGVKYGFIDKAGKVVIPLEYDFAGMFSEGLAVVGKGEDYLSIEYGFIDKNGAEVVPLEYTRARSFSEGLAMVGKATPKGPVKVGFIDKTGTVVIPLEYDDDVYDMVWSDGRIDGNFYEGLARVSKGLEYHFNDTSGLASVEGDSKYGFVDKTGAVVIPLEYDDAASFSEGLAPVSKRDADGYDKYGFIDKTGTVVIPLEYDHALNFSEGLVLVSKRDADGDHKYGFIDKTGTVVIPLEYDLDLGDDAINGIFSEGLVALHKRDADGEYKYGFIDKTGTAVVPFEYEECYSGAYDYLLDRWSLYDNGLCAVRKGASWGVFENPYWTPEDEERDRRPVLPMILVGAVIVVAVVTVLVVLMLKKKKAVPVGTPKVDWMAKQTTRSMLVPGRCPSCGCQNDQSDKFCQGCGKPLDGGGGI